MDFLQFPEIESERWPVSTFLGCILSITPAAHTYNTHTQHTYSNMFSDHEYVVCHVCKMSSHNWHCHVLFACLLSYAILLLIMHHWICVYLDLWGAVSWKVYNTFVPAASPLLMCRNVTHSDTVTVDEIGISRMNVIYWESWKLMWRMSKKYFLHHHTQPSTYVVSVSL